MIVGVAIRNDKMIIKLPMPNRHSNCFLYADSVGIDTVKEKLGTAADDQGFYTHTDRYLSRKQAIKYIRRIKQTTIGHPKYVLCSEDLW
jgi:hypothetical protein